MARPLRVLIVDDNPTNVLILEEMLGEAYRLQTATCGEDALALAQNFKPDLVLLDIMMPGLDGFGFAERVRGDEQLRTARIIMVSSHESTA